MNSSPRRADRKTSRDTQVTHHEPRAIVVTYTHSERQTMRTVYVTQNPMRRDTRPSVPDPNVPGHYISNPTLGQLIHSFDLTPAREYGNLEVLLPSGPVLLSTDNAIRSLRSKLQNFTDQDYLLCLGDPVAIAAASAMVAHLNNGVIPLLVYDRLVRKYLEIRINIHGRTDNGNRS